MKTQEIVTLLKKSIRQWNRWRAANPNLILDLRDQNMQRFRFVRNSIYSASEDSEGVDLCHCNFSGSNLESADFYSAYLKYSDFSDCLLEKASFWYADLSFVVFSSTRMAKADLSHAKLSNTIFTNVDLSKVVGLDKCEFAGPTFIDARTILLSKNLPQRFIKNAGYPVDIQKYLNSKRQKYYSCFISHSSRDSDFATKLHRDLLSLDVQCWFAPHDMRIGDEIRPTIERALLNRDKVIIILSKNSIKSQWVKDEVEATFESEKTGHKSVLFPIQIDEFLQRTRQAWAAKLRRQRHVGNFKGWSDPNVYRHALDTLLRDLTIPG